MVQYTTNVLFWNAILHVLLKYYPENKTCYTDEKVINMLDFYCSFWHSNVQLWEFLMKVNTEKHFGRMELITCLVLFLFWGRIFQEVVDILMGTNVYLSWPFVIFIWVYSLWTLVKKRDDKRNKIILLHI